MEHLICLAQILDAPLESLAGREQPPLPPAAKEKRHIRRPVLAACLLAVLVLAAVLRIHTLPVDWDAGACGGGYATYIFDKYSRQLTERYRSGSPDPEQLLSVQAVRGSQQAEWEGRTLYLRFTIAYEDAVQGAGTAQVTFIGHRYWFDSFTWGGAIVAL